MAALDFTTFADNQNDKRFERTMQSTPIGSRRPLYISDKGIPKRPYTPADVPATSINDGTNIDAGYFYTYGGLTPAYSFIGDWKSQSSQILLYYKVS